MPCINLSDLGVDKRKTSSSLTPLEWCVSEFKKHGQARASVDFPKWRAAILLIYTCEDCGWTGNAFQCDVQPYVSTSYSEELAAIIVATQKESPELLPVWVYPTPTMGMGNWANGRVIEFAFPWSQEWEEWIWILLEIKIWLPTTYWWNLDAGKSRYFGRYHRWLPKAWTLEGDCSGIWMEIDSEFPLNFRAANELSSNHSSCRPSRSKREARSRSHSKLGILRLTFTRQVIKGIIKSFFSGRKNESIGRNFYYSPYVKPDQDSPLGCWRQSSKKKPRFHLHHVMSWNRREKDCF